MGKRLIVKMLVLGIALMLSVKVSAVTLEERERKTLAGVPAVYVLVEDLSDNLKQDGLSRDMLQTDVELRLRTVGIRVATQEQSFLLPGMPYLYVTVTGLRATITGRPFGYTANVSIEFIQGVLLERDRSILAEATTWSKEELAVGPTIEVVRKAVRDLTDSFANAYLAANPR